MDLEDGVASQLCFFSTPIDAIGDGTTGRGLSFCLCGFYFPPALLHFFPLLVDESNRGDILFGYYWNFGRSQEQQGSPSQNGNLSSPCSPVINNTNTGRTKYSEDLRNLKTLGQSTIHICIVC